MSPRFITGFASHLCYRHHGLDQHLRLHLRRQLPDKPRVRVLPAAGPRQKGNSRRG
jgi:hypothetical protein